MFEDIQPKFPAGMIPIALAIVVALGSTPTDATASNGSARTLMTFTDAEQSPGGQQLRASVPADAFISAKDGPAIQRLDVPVTTDSAFALELERFDVIAPDARFCLGTAAGEVPMIRPDVVMYRGKVIDQPHSTAFFTISSNGMINGFIEADGHSGYAMGTLPEDLKAGRNVLTVQPYSAFGGPDVPFCGVTYDPKVHLRVQKPAKAPAEAAGPMLLRVAVDGPGVRRAFRQCYASARLYRPGYRCHKRHLRTRQQHPLDPGGCPSMARRR